MHGVVFLVLGLLMQNIVTQCASKGKRAVVLSIDICVIYGITDEIHQIFVPGRAFQISDLVMDTIGSIIGIAAIWVLHNRVWGNTKANYI